MKGMNSDECNLGGSAQPGTLFNELQHFADGDDSFNRYEEGKYEEKKISD